MTETSANGGSVQPPMVDGSVPQRGLNPQWGNTSTCSMACSSSRPIASTTWMTCTTICGFLVENMKDLHWLFTNYQGKDSHDFQDNKEYINPAVIDGQQVSSTSSATMRHTAPKRLEIQQRRGFRIEKQATKRGFTSHCRLPGPPLNRRQRQNTTRSDVGGAWVLLQYIRDTKN